jgi:hypothetical protein
VLSRATIFRRILLAMMMLTIVVVLISSSWLLWPRPVAYFRGSPHCTGFVDGSQLPVSPVVLWTHHEPDDSPGCVA